MNKNEKKWFIFLMLTLLSFTILILVFYANIAKAEEKLEQKSSSKNLISLNFRHIAVRDLLQILANFAGKNIVISEAVVGEISINLEKISWQEALKNITKSQHLTCEENTGTIFISPNQDTLLNNQASNALKPINTEILWHCRFAKAADIADLLLKSHSLISPTGNVVADPRTNSIWIKDEALKLQEIRHYLGAVDIPSEQVLIEARIVYADENFIRELGLKFGSAAHESSGKSGDMNMDLPLKPDTGHATIAIAKLGQGVLLDMELSALESEGRGKVISSPKLITADRESAYIESGDEVPYQEKTSSGATSLVFKKAVLGLKVTPEVASNNKITLRLQLNQDKVSDTNIHGEPTIQTRQIQTQVLISDGQTVVLGGIYEESSNHVITRVPFLGSIPILGLLFQNHEIHTEHKELLIFVTPQKIDSMYSK